MDPTRSAIIVGVVQSVVTGISTVLVDKAGRRVLLLLSDFVMALCLGVLGFYFFLKVGGSIRFSPVVHTKGIFTDLCKDAFCDYLMEFWGEALL